MAGNGNALLQVNQFTLAGIDATLRKTVVEGALLFDVAAGSLLTAAIDVAGTGYAANDTVAVAGGLGGIITVLTVSSGVPQTISIAANGSGYAAATGAATAAITGSGTGLTITTTVNAGGTIPITGWSITSNVLTFTALNSLTGGGGQSITVTGFLGAQAFLNGTYTTSSATGTTIVVSKTHANGSGTQLGLAVIQPTYTTGGVPLNYNFIDQAGHSRPIGTIGPLGVPTWFEAHSIAGSAFKYAINSTVVPNLLLIFNGVTQVADQAAITADTVAFRAEFIKNGF